MPPSRPVSRRKFLQAVTLAATASLIPGLRKSALALSSRFPASPNQSSPLEEFNYGDVTLHSVLHEQQLQQTHAVLMDLGDDALLKPSRARIGRPPPAGVLGGWYRYDPNYASRTFY